MERGTDWEREAVRRQWAELERRRRGAKVLLRGTTLLLAGVFAVFLGLVTEACVEIGPLPHGCTTAVPQVVQAVVLTGGIVAIASGAWFCWLAFRT